MWLGISQLTAGHVAENSTRTIMGDHGNRVINFWNPVRVRDPDYKSLHIIAKQSSTPADITFSSGKVNATGHVRRSDSPFNVSTLSFERNSTH